MPEKSWKVCERRIAKFFGGQRNPLSGRNSKHTAGDVIHDDLFVEVKQRKKHAVIGVWDKAKKLADKEGKIPVVCLAERNRPGFWVMVHSSDLEGVCEATQ